MAPVAVARKTGVWGMGSVLQWGGICPRRHTFPVGGEPLRRCVRNMIFLNKNKLSRWGEGELQAFQMYMISIPLRGQLSSFSHWGSDMRFIHFLASKHRVGSLLLYLTRS